MTEVELSVIRDVLIIFYVTVSLPLFIYKAAKMKDGKIDG
jgi:hypothetical protein